MYIIIYFVISIVALYAIIYFAVKSAINRSKLTESAKNINEIIAWVSKNQYPDSPNFETSDQRMKRIVDETNALVVRLKNKEITAKEFDELKQDLYK